MGDKISFKHRPIRRLGLLVSVLVLANACGGGEISEGGVRLGPEASDPLGPEASDPDGGVLSCGVCGDGEVCSSGTCVNASLPPTGTPYGHVVPADVGVTIGVGVTAPVPTAIYTGPNPITADDTLLENVVVNGCLVVGDDGQPTVDNVTVRNVIVNCDSHYGLTVTNANNVTVVNSKIDNTTDGKAVYVPYDATDIHFEKNEITGGQDFFFFHDRVADVYVENNYMHHLVGGPDAHADGFQWWPDVGNGAFYIRGNYMTVNNPTIGENALLFTGDGATTTYVFESNYIGAWGWYPLRHYAYGANLTAQYNVYEHAYKVSLPAPGLPSGAIYYDPEDGRGGAIFRCNRYQDGDFIQQQYLLTSGQALTHDITGCPSWP